MKEILKTIKADYILSSLVTIALGIVLIFYSDETISALGTLIAVAMMAIGIVSVFSYVANVVSNGFSIFFGGVMLLIGIWIFLRPEIVVTIIPIVIGALLISYGVRGLNEALAAKNYGYENWKISIFFAVLGIILGILCVIESFTLVSFAFVMIGLSLVYSGVSNIFIAVTGSRAERKYKRKNPSGVIENEDGTIEGEFKD